MDKVHVEDEEDDDDDELYDDLDDFDSSQSGTDQRNIMFNMLACI